MVCKSNGGGRGEQRAARHPRRSVIEMEKKGPTPVDAPAAIEAGAAAPIQSRKADHIALCASGEVEFRQRGTLLDEVALVHHALPDFSVDEVDLSTELLGKRLRAPIIVAGMTGGTAD